MAIGITSFILPLRILTAVGVIDCRLGGFGLALSLMDMQFILQLQRTVAQIVICAAHIIGRLSTSTNAISTNPNVLTTNVAITGTARCSFNALAFLALGFLAMPGFMSVTPGTQLQRLHRRFLHAGDLFVLN